MTKWVRREGLTSTDVIGRLYQLGIATNRDRVAEVSNLLFSPAEMRRSSPKGRGHRRYTEDQCAAVVNAFIARDRLGFSLGQLYALLADPDAAGLIRSRPCLDERDLSTLQRTALEVCA
ncbi:MAG: hypothetical protein ACRDZW_07390 [Acidimicrobiales bacterium]